MNQFLLAMCGIPASGKTLLARAIKDQIGSQLQCEIVSTDDWRDELFYSDFKPENEQKVRQMALERTRKLVADGMSVIHDDTNYYASMRHELYEIALSRQCTYAVVHITTPLNVALAWNKDRAPEIPEEVIRRINQKLDVPGSKYAWDRPLSSVNLESSNLTNVTSGIIEKLSLLEPLVPESPSLDDEKRLLDVVTRQVVGQFLKDNPVYRNNSRVSKLRREVLKIAKSASFTPSETEKMLREKLSMLGTKES